MKLPSVSALRAPEDIAVATTKRNLMISLAACPKERTRDALEYSRSLSPLRRRLRSMSTSSLILPSRSTS
jgi:hypothetical protein